MRLLLICGPWGSGTSAVAGMAAYMGALGFGPFLATTDPSTPNSFELLAFRQVLLRHASEATVALTGSAPEAVRSDLTALKQSIERHELGPYNVRRTIFLKHALACLLIPRICEVFDTRLVLVMRPITEIERTRIRRHWPQNFGAAGAEIIYRHLADISRDRAFRTIEFSYPDVLVSPLDHARRLARFAELKPNLAELQRAAAFIGARGSLRNSRHAI